MSGDAARALDPEFPNLDPAVVEGYRNAPAHMVAEILGGGLSLMPRPRRRHAHGATLLTRRLGPFYDPMGDDPGGWVILDEPELHLGPRPDIVVPDLAGWRTERVPAGFLADDAAGIQLPPDWVCEVLSPSTERLDRREKLSIYRREGVSHVWLVNPLARTLEVLALAGSHYAVMDVFAGDERVRAAPFDAVELALGLLWEDVVLG